MKYNGSVFETNIEIQQLDKLWMFSDWKVFVEKKTVAAAFFLNAILRLHLSFT